MMQLLMMDGFVCTMCQHVILNTIFGSESILFCCHLRTIEAKRLVGIH